MNMTKEFYYIAVDENDEFVPGTLSHSYEDTDSYARDYQLESASDEQIDSGQQMDLDEIVDAAEKYAYTIKKLSTKEYQELVDDDLI